MAVISFWEEMGLSSNNFIVLYSLYMKSTFLKLPYSVWYMQLIYVACIKHCCVWLMRGLHVRTRFYRRSPIDLCKRSLASVEVLKANLNYCKSYFNLIMNILYKKRFLVVYSCSNKTSNGAGSSNWVCSLRTYNSKITSLVCAMALLLSWT